MDELAGPFIWFHRRGGKRAGDGPRFQIIAWTRGLATFTPRGAAAPVQRPITRIWIKRLDKPSPAPYYDVSSQILQAQLAGYLDTHSFAGLVFSVRARGYKPHKQFGLNVEAESGS